MAFNPRLRSFYPSNEEGPFFVNNLPMQPSTRRSFLRSWFGSGAMAAAGTALVGPARAKASPVEHRPVPGMWKDDELTVAWIGHSTVLINFHGVKILTDPILFDRIGLNFFGGTIGPARITEPALSPDDIPTPDIVLLSHAHMDHMDVPSLEFLTQRSPGTIDCITAHRTSDVIEHLPWKSIQEMDWTAKYTLRGIRFDALPVKHFGWRYPWEQDRSKGQGKSGRSYNAYLLRANGKRLVFGGDTAYTESFRTLAQLDGIDVAIMPIGAYQPWHSVHCTPEEAVDMANMMKARHFLPIHCMTFRQGTETFQAPIKRLFQAIKDSPTDMKLGYAFIGQTFTMKG